MNNYNYDKYNYIGDNLKKSISFILKRLVFAIGIIYGLNVVLSNAQIYLPFNIITILVTAFLGVPGLLSLFAIFYMI